jgi:branched-chain amino acid transport system ATP-binding protein
MTVVPVLTISDASVKFGGLTVLSGLNLVVERGSLLGLVGVNGAGKTTLLNVIGGQIRLRTGSIFLDRRNITDAKECVRARFGVGRVFQESRLWPTLTIADHFKLATRSAINKVGSDVADAIALVELHDGARLGTVDELTLLDRRRVELALSFSRKPSVLLIDEIAAGLNATESASLYGYIASALKLQIIRAAVVVEHKLDLLTAYATEVALLANGRIRERIAVKGGVEAGKLSKHFFSR